MYIYILYSKNQICTYDKIHIYVIISITITIIGITFIIIIYILVYIYMEIAGHIWKSPWS